MKTAPVFPPPGPFSFQGFPSALPKNASAMSVAVLWVRSCGTVAVQSGVAARPASVQVPRKS